MGELLFIATTVFVAYVVYTAIGGNKDNPEQTTSQPEPTPESTSSPEPEPAPPAESTPPPPPTPKPVTAKPAAKAPSKTPAAKAKAAPAKKAQPASAPAATDSDSVKNPKTGEVAKLPGNYAFAKRWIKEALVEEGLLDKIYKNNELDSDTTAKIQAALQALKALKKYQ